MDSKEIGWATFWNDAATFSNSFQQQMQLQLMRKFNTAMGIENAVSERDFLLFIGMEELNIAYKQGGYAHAQVEVIGPDSVTTIAPIYWKVESAGDLLSATKKDTWTEDNIEFGWGEGFDKDYYLSYFTPKHVMPKGTHGLLFDVEYNLELFPDLGLKIFTTTALSEEELNALYHVLKEHLPEAYVAPITLGEGKYNGMIDFQGMSPDAGLVALGNALEKMRTVQGADKISLLRIE
jgi:hypothetical protein